MLNKGILEIIQLNNEFYEKHAESFDRSRDFYWKGFENSLNYLKNGQKVLDIGCGNARFYKFLKEKNLKVHYIGIDSNDKFIKENMEKFPEASFKKEDIIGNPINTENKFDLVVIFGVTHHLPNKEFRMKWLRELSKLVEDKGVIIISFWNFDKTKDDRDFKTKYYKKENGDYFLGWKGDFSSHRFCHEFNDEEIIEIKDHFNNFEILEDFKKEDNRYLILKKI